MIETNDVAQVEAPKRGRPRKESQRRERAGELRARMNFAAVALKRALKDDAASPSPELVRLALETLTGEEG